MKKILLLLIILITYSCNDNVIVAPVIIKRIDLMEITHTNDYQYILYIDGVGVRNSVKILTNVRYQIGDTLK